MTDAELPVFLGCDCATASETIVTYTVSDVIGSYRLISVEQGPPASEDVIEGDWIETPKRLARPTHD